MAARRKVSGSPRCGSLQRLLAGTKFDADRPEWVKIENSQEQSLGLLTV